MRFDFKGARVDVAFAIGTGIERLERIELGNVQLEISQSGLNCDWYAPPGRGRLPACIFVNAFAVRCVRSIRNEINFKLNAISG